MAEEKVVTLTGTLVRESEKAFLVNLDTDGETWLPKSITQQDSSSDWTIPVWFAEKEGLG